MSFGNVTSGINLELYSNWAGILDMFQAFIDFVPRHPFVAGYFIRKNFLKFFKKQQHIVLLYRSCQRVTATTWMRLRTTNDAKSNRWGGRPGGPSGSLRPVSDNSGSARPKQKRRRPRWKETSLPPPSGRAGSDLSVIRRFVNVCTLRYTVL